MSAEVDAVKNGWRLTNCLMPQAIERLVRSVIVTSTGASNRVEENKFADEEVQLLSKNMRIRRLTSRDEQEVVGYLDVLQNVFDNYNVMPVRQSTLLQLHRDMLIHSDKDQGHTGYYKIGSNRFEAKDASGNIVGVVFDPTPPYLAPIEVRDLCDWYRRAVSEKIRHPRILTANFVFEYLAIHPSHDGNGRMSPVLTNLMLLQHGYAFTTVASTEAQHLLDESIFMGEKRVNTLNGVAFVAQKTDEQRDIWHGYPESWDKIDATIQIKWKNEGRIKSRDLRKYNTRSSIRDAFGGSL